MPRQKSQAGDEVYVIQAKKSEVEKAMRLYRAIEVLPEREKSIILVLAGQAETFFRERQRRRRRRKSKKAVKKKASG